MVTSEETVAEVVLKGVPNYGSAGFGGITLPPELWSEVHAEL